MNNDTSSDWLSVFSPVCIRDAAAPWVRVIAAVPMTITMTTASAAIAFMFAPKALLD
jgi:hypothetical protein